MPTLHAIELREQIEWSDKRNADHAVYLRGFLAIVKAIDNLNGTLESFREAFDENTCDLTGRDSALDIIGNTLIQIRDALESIDSTVQRGQ